MSIKEYPGSEKKEACYRVEHGGSGTLWVSTVERDWLFSYAQFLHVEWDASSALVISFSTHQVRIVGQNLRPIVESLSNLSLAHITLKFHAEDHWREGNPFIQKIEVISAEE